MAPGALSRRLPTSPGQPQSQTGERKDGDKLQLHTLEWHRQRFLEQQKAWRAIKARRAEGHGGSVPCTFPPITPPSAPLYMRKPLPPLPSLRYKSRDDGLTTREAIGLDPSLVVRPLVIRRRDGAQVQHPRLLADAHKAQDEQKGEVAFPTNARELHPLFPNTDNRRQASHAHPPSEESSSTATLMQRSNRVNGHPQRRSYYVGDPGLLGVPLSVYGFRGSLPKELQPNEPPLRWDLEPAPQLPPIKGLKVSPLFDDQELARLKASHQSLKASYYARKANMQKGEIEGHGKK